MENKKNTPKQGKKSDQSQENTRTQTGHTTNSVTEIMEVVDSLP